MMLVTEIATDWAKGQRNTLEEHLMRAALEVQEPCSKSSKAHVEPMLLSCLAFTNVIQPTLTNPIQLVYTPRKLSTPLY
jgi:hypothetical protein